MLDFEQAIQDRLNQAVVVATQEALHQFDTDGSPITIGSVTLTSKGQLPKEYQTPTASPPSPRHVYQSPHGGKTYCPLDRDARIVTSSTPRFAKMIAHKCTPNSARAESIDLEENHGRKVGAARPCRMSPTPSPPWRWPRRSRGTTPCPRWSTRSRPSRGVGRGLPADV